MVLPLKLTQFYGHSIPRPRVYTDVKFSESRVDPPSSVNDALLSWASNAPWANGGLSQHRLRAQGKLEGSASKLRNLLEEEEEEVQVAAVPEAQPESEKTTSKGHISVKRKKIESEEGCHEGEIQKRKMKKEADDHDENEATPVSKLRKMNRSEKLRGHSDDESVETPVRSQREIREPQSSSLSDDDDVPSTVDKLRTKSSKSRPVHKSPVSEARQTRSVSKSPVPMRSVEPAELGRTTRSAKKAPHLRDAEKKKGKAAARKINID